MSKPKKPEPVVEHVHAQRASINDVVAGIVKGFLEHRAPGLDLSIEVDDAATGKRLLYSKIGEHDTRNSAP